MNMTLTIEIPIRKHLYKYYIKEFKTRLTFEDPLGIILYYMLRTKTGERYSEHLREKYPEKIVFELPYFMLERKYVTPYLSQQALTHFDRIIDSDFKRSLYRFVARQVSDGVDRQIAIEEFCKLYDILENDISFEALKKADYRYRSSQKQAA